MELSHRGNFGEGYASLKQRSNARHEMAVSQRYEDGATQGTDASN